MPTRSCCGLADALVDSADLPAIRAALAEGSGAEALAGLRRDGEPLLAAEREWVDECYAGDDPVEVLGSLRAHAAPAARAAATLLAQRSPLSVAVTLEAIRRAADMATLEQVLEQDRVLSAAFMGSPDFSEGVRAVLVDRDHQPRWTHPSLGGGEPRGGRPCLPRHRPRGRPHPPPVLGRPGGTA